MSSTLSTTSTGISPAFPISAEEFRIWYGAVVTRIDIDGVQPPMLGANGGFSRMHAILNLWHPWLDEKIVEPKWDGICQFTGTISNRPTYVKDYHTISVMRAVDHLLAPVYIGEIRARVGSVTPTPPPRPR